MSSLLPAQPPHSQRLSSPQPHWDGQQLAARPLQAYPASRDLQTQPAANPPLFSGGGRLMTREQAMGLTPAEIRAPFYGGTFSAENPKETLAVAERALVPHRAAQRAHRLPEDDALLEQPASSAGGSAPSRPTRRAPPALKGSRASAAQAASQAQDEGGGGAKSSGDTGFRFQPKRAAPPPEPSLMVLKLLYLSRMPSHGFFQKPATFLMSVHVGTEARNDVPSQPGRFSTTPVAPHPPRAVNPEEDALRARIARAIVQMATDHQKSVLAAQQKAAADGQDPGPPPPPPPEETGLECRYNERLAVPLADVGPGPSAGGPAYFRIDIWSIRPPGFLERESKQELWGRVFVPLTDAKCQRRPCTWPVVDIYNRDIAYLTCEFAFAHTPPTVSSLQVEDVSATEVALTWNEPPGDAVVPVLGYTVEATVLPREPVDRGREGSSAPGRLTNPPAAWQQIGKLPATSAPGTLARNLRGNTRYRFRVRAVNEAGLGEPEEIDAITAPVAPGACGRPRLAGCSGPVLSIEWDAPSDTGGVPVVSYRIWVRPYSASKADASEWQETGSVKHREGRVQRADVRTEELDPAVGRYLCSVAAVNSAGEIGPATPDNVALPFPNPCAISGPNQADGPLPLANWAAAGMGNFRLHDLGAPVSGGGNMGLMLYSNEMPALTYVDPGNKRLNRMPLLPAEEVEARLAEILEPGSHAGSLSLQRHGGLGAQLFDQQRGLSPGLEGYSGAGNGGYSYNDPNSPAMAAEQRAAAAAEAAAALLAHQPHASAYNDSREETVPEQASSLYYGGHSADASAIKEQPSGSGQQPHLEEEFQSVRQRLQEKREQMEASFSQYKEVTGLLHHRPEDPKLLQRHEMAEIEAAGLQAEVAVLTQRLKELDGALRTGGHSQSTEADGFLGFSSPSAASGYGNGVRTAYGMLG
eukprot:TRINITY_DN32617_c0_g1_i1.p1 TRINITY_DN32617_c0_g1~~TRINITY_DN32617_c0_g1_i1.p1  ORF type:complete len:925 (+),score=174.41 TRINITY_DN32617_c0_g1_i1:180-2954(+)